VTDQSDSEGRQAELVAAVGAVRARIAHACEQVERDPRSVTLIAVTKTYPASDVAALVRLGVPDIGENRDQEASAKAAAVAELLGNAAPPVWHFVGRLQSRKSRSVASYANAVHSLDRPELVGKLADAIAAAGRAPLDVFVQVSLDDDPARGGAPIRTVSALAAAVAARTELRLRGLMAVPPLGSDPDAEYARLAELAGTLRTEHPDATAISAGMSDDFEIAIRHGSTHVRVGTALLGRRAPVFG
jgi:pyridoxal phosphate enzyme (YggS family)